MRKVYVTLLLWSCCSICFGQKASSRIDWIKNDYPSFDIFYSAQDSSISPLIIEMINEGQKQVTDFFEHPFKHKFSVYVFPSRHDLDLQWQHDYGDTSIHSECWMVASGVGDVLQILSQQVWKNEEYEHNADDTAAMQKLATHELVHVYQGQYNPIHDFTGLDSLAWFIEGVAVYASGQLNKTRMQQVKFKLLCFLIQSQAFCMFARNLKSFA